MPARLWWWRGQRNNTQMTKICLAHPNRDNYSETFIHNHLRHLQPAVSLSGGWRPYLTQHNENIINIPLGQPVRILTKRLLPALYPAFYTHFLSGFLQRQRFEVVLAEYGITGVGVLEACRRTRTPLVVHFHGFDASDKATLKQYGAGYRKVFAHAKALIAVSTDMRAKLVELGADGNKVFNIPYGVDARQFQGATPETAEKIVLAVGRFAGKKAPHLTIRAFHQVLQAHPDARLVMVGSGELLETCRKLVAELQIGGSVEFAGVQTAAEIAVWHRHARLFVQHSMVNPDNGDSEGTPNTILEASAAGLPIVSTRHAGIKDAVAHGTTGFLTAEGDVEAMAGHITALLENPALAGEMGRQARAKMIREYGMNLQIGKLREVLTRK